VICVTSGISSNKFAVQYTALFSPSSDFLILIDNCVQVSILCCSQSRPDHIAFPDYHIWCSLKADILSAHYYSLAKYLNFLVRLLFNVF